MSITKNTNASMGAMIMDFEKTAVVELTRGQILYLIDILGPTEFDATAPREARFRAMLKRLMGHAMESVR